MATKTARVAWLFKTELRWLTDLKKRLDPVTATAWIKFDSDSGTDFVATRLSEHAKIAIYDYGQAFVASIQIDTEEAQLATELESAKAYVLEKILPAIGAREVKDTAPPERE